MPGSAGDQICDAESALAQPHVLLERQRLGTSRDSARSFQKRFDGPAKWCPVNAERTPGLIPTNSTRSPGPIDPSAAGVTSLCRAS